ncbi:P-II family nitrogen regulator [Christiangramia fulva]|uniref:P-II family nitrogen regulator n=1 Tax=Christiangramia fulva TaxID=2126553 RepID=A0A2R3Z222_9FLAO|nr:P-II family nitrogen regulator [Christiangramia fulva]AVR44292.1 P-II family nitrogen regulator [Christiangramia fulva]
MREVKAFIREERTVEVVEGLRKAGFRSLTVSPAEGTGKFTGKKAMPSLQFPVTHSKMTNLQIVCRKEDVEEIVKIIHKHGSRDKQGEGLIYISEVLELYKVRTGKKSREDI